MIEPIAPSIFNGIAVTAGFTTRRGGMSKPPFDTLNLGCGTPDDTASVAGNMNLFLRHCGVENVNAAFMEQVHGSRVDVVNGGGTSPAADGLVTAVPGVLLCVKTADCIPLLIADPDKPAVAAVHCGWRPIVGGIVEKAAAVMRERFGSRPDKLLAVMGPSAGPCCYEIGEDVAGRLDSGSIVHRDGRLFGDLRKEVLLRLVSAGVRRDSVEFAGQCTICHEDDYFSHRRDGKNSGRMAGYIMIVKDRTV